MIDAAPATMDDVDFRDTLAGYREQTLTVLMERLPQREPYRHLYGPINDYLQNIGKGFRPALCLATCSAFGGRTEDALNSAAAIEMLHSAFLVHDDIEDGSEFRRGLPTMHTRIGLPLALNTGDAMQAMSMRLLRPNIDELGPTMALQIYDEFDHMLAQSLEGQAMELGWIHDNAGDIGPADYLRMTLKKTCWYSFIHPCRIGAIIAKSDPAYLEPFTAFGFYLGAAFQIQDDLLNILGVQKLYGKETMGDLYEGKRSLMLTRLFAQSNGQERQRLHRFLATPRDRRLQSEVAWVHQSMVNYQCLDYARSAAEDLARKAADAFEQAYASVPENRDKAFLRHCLRFMIDRKM